MLTDLFNQGQRPAVSAGLSVSRVGGNAQIKAMRQVAGKLRLDLAQYRELAAFAQFASDLDKATRDQLTRGEKLSEILKQPQFAPLAVEKQVTIIWAATNGYLDDVETAKIRDFEIGLYRYLESTDADLLPAIAKEKAISDDLTGRLKKAVLEYRRQSGLGVGEEEAAPTPESSAEGAPPAADEEPPAEKPKAAPMPKAVGAARKPRATRKKGSGA
jgi:F-type H+-transporting ATPase subunit alpha